MSEGFYNGITYGQTIGNIGAGVSIESKIPITSADIYNLDEFLPSASVSCGPKYGTPWWGGYYFGICKKF